MIFIVIYVCILVVAVNYSITFRTKNQIVNIIEQYEGAKSAIPVIEEYIENVGYYNSTIKAVNNGKCDIGNSNYCITAQWCRSCIDQEHATCKLTANTSKGTCTYKTTCENKYHYILGQNTCRSICGDNETITTDYNEDGGSKVDNVVCTFNDKLVLPTTIPAKEGYTFNGWLLADGKTKKMVVNQ